MNHEQDQTLVWISYMTYEEEGQVKVCKRGPREEQLDRVVDEFDLEHIISRTMGKTIKRKTYLENDLAEEVLSRCPYSEEEYCSMNGGKQGAVKPTTTLGDELGDL